MSAIAGISALLADLLLLPALLTTFNVTFAGDRPASKVPFDKGVVQ
ncbi:MAG: hypothetical protein RRB13_02435 [bacterium]|nr:hypothetical protein [bacterium]